jgi:PPOX class probable F420-dependent enzyme
MDSFAALTTHQYINLITFRNSGATIATTVWFVHDHHTLYVRTGYNAGKVKRIHRNSHISVAPCNQLGTPLGPQIPAHARICAPVEHARINTLLNQKYGVMKHFIDVMARLRSRINEYDFIEITSVPNTQA